jgi:MFS family permease
MKYKADKPTAACIMAIPNWISAIGTFIAGAAIDYFGRRTLILIFSSSLLALSHGLMTLTSITPYLTLSILGVGAMVYNAVIWPSISMVIPQKYAGLAYGTATCILNTIYTISPLVVGHILDSIHDYYYVELFYFILLIASVGTNFGLHFADRLKNNSILNRNNMRISNSSHLNSPLADDSDRSALTNSEEISKNA